MEYTPCDAPFDKNGVYFFTVPKFHRTGTFRLVFHVIPIPLYYVNTAIPEGEAGRAVPVIKKPYNIKPLEFTVQVRVPLPGVETDRVEDNACSMQEHRIWICESLAV